jgi:hypothetical protein
MSTPASGGGAIYPLLLQIGVRQQGCCAGWGRAHTARFLVDFYELVDR